MEEYKNKEYLKQQIMGDTRHHMLYGYNNAKRKDLIESILKEYPIQFDCDVPAAILVDDYGLPVVDKKPKEEDMPKLKISSSEYLQLSMASAITKRLIEARGYEFADERAKPLINYANKASQYKGSIESLDDLQEALEESKGFYKNTFEEVLLKGKESGSIDLVRIPFINIESFIYHVRESTKNNSHFAILINKDRPIAPMSTEQINFYTGARINDIISMKIFTEPEAWETYLDCNGQIVLAVHDYGDIQLDSAMKDHIKKVKRKYNGN